MSKVPALAAVILGMSTTLWAAEQYPLESYLTGIAEQQWKARAERLATLKKPSDVMDRRQFIREEFLRAIGGLPGTAAPLNPRITGVLERTGYRIEKLIYESLPGNFVTANLYVPTTHAGPFPAVLGAAGHAMQEGKAAPVYQSAFVSLALRGYVVLAYDPPGQGERFEHHDPVTGEVRSIGHVSPGLQCLLTDGLKCKTQLRGWQRRTRRWFHKHVFRDNGNASHRPIRAGTRASRSSRDREHSGESRRARC